jgi:hypothetical protein
VSDSFFGFIDGIGVLVEDIVDYITARGDKQASQGGSKSFWEADIGNVKIGEPRIGAGRGQVK